MHFEQNLNDSALSVEHLPQLHVAAFGGSVAVSQSSSFGCANSRLCRGSSLWHLAPRVHRIRAGACCSSSDSSSSDDDNHNRGRRNNMNSGGSFTARFTMNLFSDFLFEFLFYRDYYGFYGSNR